MSGLECTPMSDGSTNIVQRKNTKTIFDKHETALYPRTMNDHPEAKALKAELLSNYSMMDRIKTMSLLDQERGFQKIQNFQYKNTYDKIVEPGIN